MRSILEGILPSLALVLFMILLPNFMMMIAQASAQPAAAAPHCACASPSSAPCSLTNAPPSRSFLSQSEGWVAFTDLQTRQMSKLFIFAAVNVFGGNVVAGSVFIALEDLTHDPIHAV